MDNYKGDYTRTIDNKEKGVIIEYLNIGETNPWCKFGHVYPKKLAMTINEIYKWQSEEKLKLQTSDTKKYTRIIPWKITKYSCVRIFRNKSWWKKNIKFITECWDEVLHYRKIGYTDLLTVPSKRKKIVKIIPFSEYSFLSDSEDETN